MQYVFKLKEYFPNILFYTIGNQQYIKILAENVWHFLYFIKNHTNTLFQQLIDLSLVDYPERKFRFEIIYNLLSIKYNTRLIITSATTEGSYFDSITNIYFGANWYEREAWDMFGLFFKNHPDLRRMLTDYGFKGHPLRKDFPMTGYIEVRYDDFLKRILYEEVSLTQEYRIFSLENPWTSNFESESK